jgi:hypothetical protein
MIGEMKHHVLFQYDIRDAVRTSHEGMGKGFYVALPGKHIREIQEMPEIMNAPSRDGGSF